MIEVILGFLISGLLIALYGLAKVWEKVTAVHIELRGLQNSTHQLTYIDPMAQTYDSGPTTNKELEQFADAEGNPLGSIV